MANASSASSRASKGRTPKGREMRKKSMSLSPIRRVLEGYGEEELEA